MAARPPSIEANSLLSLPYEYSPLSSASTFRVLELLPGTGDDTIRHNLQEADWNNPPVYEAISYAWGDASIQVPTICDGRTLCVTQNLIDGLRQMRFKDRSRLLWADAACINQGTDIAALKERGHQVSNMRTIYKNASKVLVWLGTDEDGKGELAIEHIRKITRLCCQRAGISEHQLQHYDRLFDVLPEIQEVYHDDNSDCWNLLAGFFARPWFGRLWVFQEVNSDSEVRMLCGASEVDWNHVGLVTTYIRSNTEVSIQWATSFRNNMENAEFMRDRGLHKLCKIPRLLAEFRTFGASDPLDRVYALMGMPQIRDLSPPLEVDYLTTRVELYQNIATRCIQDLHGLQILGYAQHEGQIDETFPSWVPQWDLGWINNPVNATIGESFWRASGSSTLSTTVSCSILTIAGIVWDVIETQTKIGRDEWFSPELHEDEKHPFLELYRSQIRQTAMYPTGEETIEAYAVVLTAGLSSSFNKATEELPEFMKDFAAYMSRLLQSCGQSKSEYETLIENTESGNYHRYYHRAYFRSLNRSFFRTQKGYMGLGPNVIEIGDLVCVLFGGHVTFILRPKNGYFLLVGEAYVHGIMEGEAFEKWEAGELKEQVFEIH